MRKQNHNWFTRTSKNMTQKWKCERKWNEKKIRFNSWSDAKNLKRHLINCLDFVVTGWHNWLRSYPGRMWPHQWEGLRTWLSRQIARTLWLKCHNGRDRCGYPFFPETLRIDRNIGSSRKSSRLAARGSPDRVRRRRRWQFRAQTAATKNKRRALGNQTMRGISTASRFQSPTHLFGIWVGIPDIAVLRGQQICKKNIFQRINQTVSDQQSIIEATFCVTKYMQFYNKMVHRQIL